MKKLRVGVMFGGKSGEHEVSLESAKNVIAAMNPEQYEIVSIKIEKNGAWDQSLLTGIDVVFPVLHGPFGEDGTMQGLLKLASIPFVGAGVLGSAVGMDKDVMKRLLRDAGVPIAKFITLQKHEVYNSRELYTRQLEMIEHELGLSVFVKPANLGSSVGVQKAKTRAELETAIRNAFQYDTKILVEEFVKAREIECAVLGNENPAASIPGEIIPHHEFYSYEAKYTDPDGAGLEIPAKLSPEIITAVQTLAIKVFKTLCCEGMGRVDLFLKEDGSLVANEINTIPGFTKISMYPKLWEASGIPYTELIDHLIQLAIERFEREQKLKIEK